MRIYKKTWYNLEYYDQGNIIFINPFGLIINISMKKQSWLIDHGKFLSVIFSSASTASSFFRNVMVRQYFRINSVKVSNSSL